MDFKDKAPSRRVRLFYLVLLWIPGGLFIWGLWIMAWGLAVPFMLVGLWGTWDYLQRGDFFGDMDAAVSEAGGTVLEPYEESKSRFRDK